MRILHTSDWHLGQHFMGKSREQEHRAFIHWLLDTVNTEKVDALIIAGDIFDTGTPPSYARALYNQFIVRLQNTCCQQLVVLGGNHDSVATLNESKDLLACLNTHVSGGVAERAEDQVLTLNNAEGKAGAVLCAIPFIRPREVLDSRAGDSGVDKQLALQEAIASHYQTIFDLAKIRSNKEQANDNLPIIATGHLTTVGGQMSESVREIYIGTLTAFPASAFPKADYIALGHLHRGQRVSEQNHIRYSGSPIPLSFDEVSARKQVLIVDFKENRLNSVTSVEVPEFRPLISLKGSLESIQKQLSALDKEAFDKEVFDKEVFDKELGDNKLIAWLEVEVAAADDYLNDLQIRVEQMITDLPVELLRVRRKREKSAAALTTDNLETLAELNVEDVFIKRLQNEALSDDKLTLLHNAFREIVSDVEEGMTQATTSEKREVR